MDNTIKANVLLERMLKQSNNKELKTNNFERMNETIKQLPNEDSAIFSILLGQILTKNKTHNLVCQFDVYDINQIWLKSAKNKTWANTFISDENWEFLSAVIYNYFKEVEKDPERAKELLNMEKVNKFEDLKEFLDKFNDYFKNHLENVIKTTKSFSGETKNNLLCKNGVDGMKNNEKKILEKYNQTVEMIGQYKLSEILLKLPLIINKLFGNKVKTK